MNKKYRADLALLLATLFWGMTFPLIRDAVTTMSPFWFVVLRGAMATLIMLPFVISRLRHTEWSLFRAGLVLGTLNAITYMTQTIGLKTINASQSAFITGTSVIMVPFLLPLAKLGKPNISEIGFSLLCLLGLFILMGAHFSAFHVGYVWTLVCALSTAIAIVYLQKVSRNLQHISLLAFYQVMWMAPVASLFGFGLGHQLVLSKAAIIAILFCAIIATDVALFLQAKFQRDTTATHAALIFIFEPVFATLFAVWVNHERITLPIIIGGVIILFSILGIEWVQGLCKRN